MIKELRKGFAGLLVGMCLLAGALTHNASTAIAAKPKRQPKPKLLTSTPALNLIRRAQMETIGTGNYIYLLTDVPEDQEVKAVLLTYLGDLCSAVPIDARDSVSIDPHVEVIGEIVVPVLATKGTPGTIGEAVRRYDAMTAKMMMDALQLEPGHLWVVSSPMPLRYLLETNQLDPTDRTSAFFIESYSENRAKLMADGTWTALRDERPVQENWDWLSEIVETIAKIGKDIEKAGLPERFGVGGPVAQPGPDCPLLAQ
jgi:hypothetical protein